MRRCLFLLLSATILFSFFSFYSCSQADKSGISYEITAEYRPEEQTVVGALKCSFENREQKEVSALHFHLYPNAYRKGALYPAVVEEKAVAYYAGESYGEMTVTGVIGVKSWNIEGEDEDILSIQLIEPLKMGDSVVVDISFVTKLASVAHQLGVAQRTVNLGYFYPILSAVIDGEFAPPSHAKVGEPFSLESSDYTLVLTLPSGYAVGASGALIGNKGLESKTKYVYQDKNLRDFALVISEDYKYADSKVGETTISYYYYDDVEAEKNLQTARLAFEYFEKTFGQYPYSHLTFAQTGYAKAGEAHTALVWLCDSLGEEDYTKELVLQTARQWWGIVAGHNRTQEAWLGESLAAYSALLFFEAYPAYGVSFTQEMDGALKEYREYFSVYGSIFGGVDTRMSKPLFEYANGYEYRCLTRDKGLVLWNTVKKSVGAKKFFKGLAKSYQTGKYKILTVKGVEESFSNVGMEIGGLLLAFVDGKAVL